MSLWLDDDELYNLTGYRQREHQRKALIDLGVKFKTRPADGMPLVLRAEFDKPRRRVSDGPDFGALETA